jgi:hypothetical protein
MGVTACLTLGLVLSAAAQDPARPKDQKDSDSKPKPAAQPSGADEELDKLLEKIADSEPDAPRTKTDRPKMPGLPGGTPAKKPVGDPSAEKLDRTDQGLDKHLEELLGRRRRRPNDPSQKQQGGQSGSPADDENSPLGRTVRKMREVEKRLGQRDTGEQTRERQGQILKDLDQLIAQARRAAQQGQGQGRTQREIRQAQNGQQGNNPDNQQGATAQGVGPGRPKTPTNIRALVGDKDVWGNLPPALREEMENVFREEALPSSSEKISRYYEAINKKSTAGASPAVTR